MSFYQNSLSLVIGGCLLLALIHISHLFLEHRQRALHICIAISSLWIGLDALLYLCRIAIRNTEEALPWYYAQQFVKFLLPAAVLMISAMLEEDARLRRLRKTLALALALVSMVLWSFLLGSSIHFPGTGQSLVVLPWGEQFWQYHENPRIALLANGGLLLGATLILALGFQPGATWIVRLFSLLYGLSLSLDLVFRISGVSEIRLRWFGFALLPFFAHWYLLKQQVQMLQLQRNLDMERHRLALYSKEQEFILRAVVHDFRSPLLTISGSAEELRQTMETGGNPEEIASYFAFIDKAVHRMQGLLQALVSVLRAGHRKLQIRRFLPASEINEILEMSRFQQEAAMARFEVDCPHSILADKDAFSQIIQNLLENSLKFRMPGKTLELRFWSETDEDAVRLHCQDNGVGMSYEETRRAGAPFLRFSNSEGLPGQGVGLSICRKTMAQMGGTMEIFSKPGAGTDIVLIFSCTSV
ncbi:MAG TPA: HAMP domain-containing sensor histidine kinase [Fibrobacteraceae bacterium]|nr:HAMP domain-containing sensor histidine kinase [Fibrobacteraceae bacterium]